MEAGVGWEEGEAEREKSARVFLCLHFSSSPCQKQSGPDLDVLYPGLRPSLLRDRGDDVPRQGHRTTACNRHCSPCDRGLHAKLDGPEETDTLQPAHGLAPA